MFKQSLAILCLLATSAATFADVRSIYLTRHAEKADTGSDPVLTVEGQQRAQISQICSSGPTSARFTVPTTIEPNKRLGH